MKPTLTWEDGKVWMLDQNRLPAEEAWVSFDDYRAVAEAIRVMTVRGAPAIGVAAAFGLALAAQQAPPARFDAALEEACHEMAATCPTAVNLFWAIERMRGVMAATAGRPAEQRRSALLRAAREIAEEDVAINRSLGRHGAALLRDGDTVLTHCNAGALATAGYGTALGVLRAAAEAGLRMKVYADETRPRWQGLKLTAWELMRDGFDVTVIADNAAGSLMRAGRISSVIVGADRIAANGDVANKIGTYNVAALAHHHGIPFYVAAPWSTIDAALPTGDGITIEERDGSEVTHVDGQPIGPEGVKVYNPAFDVTPAELVTAIITEGGVCRPPYDFRPG